VETQKEFKGMLWGQTVKVQVDHKKLDPRMPRINLWSCLSVEIISRGEWSQKLCTSKASIILLLMPSLG